jgi:hypothetical protein
MKTLLAILMLAAACAVAQDAKIIPVDAWPKKITTADKVIFNPTPEQCVKAGYRLIPAKPSTPDGKQIKSAELVQDGSGCACAGSADQCFCGQSAVHVHGGRLVSRGKMG